MFIGRVYDKKKSKQATNTNTYNEQVKKRGRSRSRSLSDEETEEDMSIDKSDKNSANFKKSKNSRGYDSADELERDSDHEDYVKTKKSSGKEGGDKTFMERINEKVKKLKRDNTTKEPKEPKLNGAPVESKQTVYSIPTDVEKGMKKGKTSKVEGQRVIGYGKDKFESIELDSGDEKRKGGDGGTKSVAVQATPYPPFRLRVLPHPDWQESETTLLKLVRLVLCQCGLTCIILTWAFIGALVFRLTEAPREYSQVQEMNRRQTELVVGLATDLRQVVPEEPVWRTTIEHYATHHESLILSAVASGYPQRGTIWTYSGCLLFATSLLKCHV
ncbi:uncharacterized protein LOC128990899 isoform X1 [Macrosteles quadrilineatus]|uniref:uncharacterized protein LOC128990899 isoform X1 n=1 Tax=Macrosteles quadrilineatus TaxID=74068 RepID=UPI0023E16F9C|nr:uncharacterized protein LOC128990899 isoform X1 [Macrosteles quadrilineatus]XP_054269523.1 uncharacterized protein LOC128990899 isoform X1 [Macrosteles quadrilineatus]